MRARWGLIECRNSCSNLVLCDLGHFCVCLSVYEADVDFLFQREKACMIYVKIMDQKKQIHVRQRCI